MKFLTLHTAVILRSNKKVLLRERKRHTACRIASTRYAALSNPLSNLSTRGMIQTWSGGYPSQTWPGWYPGYHPTIQTWWGVPGVPPPSRPGRGLPRVPLTQTWSEWYPRYPPTIQTWDGVPPTQTGDGIPPGLRWGTPLPRPEMGYPPTQT